MTWRPSSLLDRLAPGSYHAKHVAAEALRELAARGRPARPATPVEERVRNVRRNARRHALRALRNPRDWPVAWRIARGAASNVRAIRAQADAAALCAERGHVTYLPDRSCPSFPGCEVCVRCGYEHHDRRGRRRGLDALTAP